MKYLDEEIIKRKQGEKRKEFYNLQTGMYVKESLIQFKRVYLEEIGVTITLPINFVTMPDSIKKVKYPVESRPSLVKTSLDTGVNFTFTRVFQRLGEKQLSLASKQMRMIIQRIDPANIFFEEGQEVTDFYYPICWFDYKSYALDDQIYNFMYLMLLSEEIILHGCFNCKFDDGEEWKQIVSQVIKTIAIGDQTGGCKNESTEN